ncbi:hypothetical protein CIPAW_05G092600 [Carya illinoinensis]|uniref:Uncharacterized protein n=2 Tax=Carya illinoinensis TaxID=32201 RepID=A0A8T1QHJ1_CARIL|nr:hypothetical protein CIPAW_05G092600 [Carya illinoinensis]
MNTRGRGSAACGDNCGCPVPCPGGVACRSYYKCTPTSVQSTTSARDEHTTCSCGEHCGCNPCICPKSMDTTGSGKAFCKCGDGCTCYLPDLSKIRLSCCNVLDLIITKNLLQPSNAELQNAETQNIET